MTRRPTYRPAAFVPGDRVRVRVPEMPTADVGHVETVKWSSETGWWYEVRHDVLGGVGQIPEAWCEAVNADA